jgi:copper chaperone
MSTDTITYSVQGMSCQHCVAALTEALTTVRGVRSVEVSLEDASAHLSVETDEFVDDGAIGAAAGAGYPISRI